MGFFDLFNKIRRTPSNNDDINEECHQITSYNNNTSSIFEDYRSSFYRLEDIRHRSMGTLMLSPYDAQAYMEFEDAKILSLLANTNKIKRFLPGLNFSDELQCKKMLYSYVIQTESQLGVTYVIREGAIPLGMIMIHTPLFNKKTLNLSIWTIDFFILEIAEHKGIMYQSIIRVLNEMKNIMSVDVVYALVDKDNVDCIKLIGNGLFQQVDNTGFNSIDNGEPPLVYIINLSEVKFVKQ